MIALTLSLLAVLVVAVSAGEKRGTEYLRRPVDHHHQGSSDHEGPISFSHFSVDHIPPPSTHHQQNKLPVFRVPVAVQVPRSVPVALVSPVPYYVEKPVPVPVKEVPVITKVPVHYLNPVQQYHPTEYHTLDNTYPHLQPFYKQYHALRSKNFALCRWSNSVHMVNHPLLHCQPAQAYNHQHIVAGR